MASAPSLHAPPTVHEQRRNQCALRCVVRPLRIHHDQHASTTALLLIKDPEYGRAGALAASRSPQSSFVASAVGRMCCDPSAPGCTPPLAAHAPGIMHRSPMHRQPHIMAFACRFPDMAWVLFARSTVRRDGRIERGAAERSAATVVSCPTCWRKVHRFIGGSHESSNRSAFLQSA